MARADGCALERARDHVEGVDDGVGSPRDGRSKGQEGRAGISLSTCQLNASVRTIGASEGAREGARERATIWLAT